jgi:DNA polymerase
MDIVTIDMETYYDKDYSLSKMTTEAYVRDPRFEVIGVAVKVNDHPTDWYSGSDPGKFLRSLDYRDKAILAHNTMFDGAILSWHFGIKPKLWLDTLSMARPLHNIAVGGSLKNLTAYYGLGEKGDEVLNAIGKRRLDFTTSELQRYASYCCNDVELTYKLFKRMARGFPPSEIAIIDQTLRMYTEPMLVLDRAVLDTHLTNEINRKEALLNSLGNANDFFSVGITRDTLMSNEKLATYLTVLGIDPPTKTSPTTGKKTWAFSKSDKGFTKLLEHENPFVSNIVAARLGVKSTIEESRTRSLLGVSERGPLPIMLNYYGAHTGRFSGGDKMNLQNLPRGGALRKSICAPPGKMLVACDSSQIEARVLAWVAGQNDIVQAFAEGRDIYSEFASVVYGRKITKADKLERFVGKTCILGLGYGMGSIKFRDTLALGMGGIKVDVEEHEAQRIVALYRDRNQRIAALWNRCNAVLAGIINGDDMNISHALPSLVTSAEGIKLPNGFFIRYPMLTQYESGYAYAGDARVYREAVKNKVIGKGPPTDKFIRIYGGKVVENIVQALARIVVAEQMAMIGRRYKVVLQVHDEVVILCDEAEVEEAKAYMIQVMSTPPSWAPDLPVACEADHGPNYGECK